MYGFIIRAAPQALFFGLLAAFLSLVSGELVSIMTDGPATTDDLLVASLNAISSNFVLIGLVALGITFIGRAVLEAEAGVG